MSSPEACVYPDPSSRSARIFERACDVMPGGNSRETVYFPPYPVYAVRGKGARVVDADGVERIDFVNSFSSGIHGHAHPAIVDAVRQQAERLVCVALPTELEVELAEILCERVPAFDRLRFCNSGTEAVMLSIKAARAYTGKPVIAKIEGAYHGTYDVAETSQNATPRNWGDPAAPASVPVAEGTPESTLGETLVLPFNDAAASGHLLESRRNELAAILVDPLPGRMSYTPATRAYLSFLREWCDRHGVVLIFDEVMSFRVARSGMQGLLGVTPDLCTVGKIVGGGLPIGVVGGRADIMDVFDPRKGHARVPHGGSFNAHPMSMAAGIAAMGLLDDDAFAHLQTLGDRLRGGLDDAFVRAGFPGYTKGVGSLAAIVTSDIRFDDYRGMVPAGADHDTARGIVNRVLAEHPQGAELGRDDLRALLLDTPQLMGVESIEVDTVNLRMVARTLPGKQFEVGRRLRILIIAALATAGIATKEHPPTVSNFGVTGEPMAEQADTESGAGQR